MGLRQALRFGRLDHLRLLFRLSQSRLHALLQVVGQLLLVLRRDRLQGGRLSNIEAHSYLPCASYRRPPLPRPAAKTEAPENERDTRPAWVVIAQPATYHICMK